MDNARGNLNLEILKNNSEYVLLLQAMAIYANLQNQNQISSQDQEGTAATRKVDPDLLASIDEEIRKVKDSEFKDSQIKGLAQDSRFKEGDIKSSKTTSKFSEKRKKTKEDDDI